MPREREREREREEEEFYLYQKLWDLLDYREKVDKSGTMFIVMPKAQM